MNRKPLENNSLENKTKHISSFADFTCIPAVFQSADQALCHAVVS
jgi:hypothetical protein